MDEVLYVRPGLLRNYGDQANCTFVLVTTPELASRVHFDESGSQYRCHMAVTATSVQEAHDAIAGEAPQWSHILVVMPGIYFRSPAEAVLGKAKKLGVLACFSTPTDLAALNHFLRQAERTDPGAQSRFAERFFQIGERSDFLELRDDRYGTSARFNHLGDTLMWHEQVGSLSWGEQQLLPSGEISVLPVEVFGQDISEALDVTGELLLGGPPILHAGSVSFQRSDQARIYDALKMLRASPVCLCCERGYVTEIRAVDKSASGAAYYLKALCDIDSRYGTLVEMGFGCNFTHELLDSNSAMNEVHGNPAGVVHLGFGLLPFTQYHVDFLCPGTRLVSSGGQDLLGPNTDAREWTIPSELRTAAPME